MHLAGNIRKVMAERGLSQKELVNYLHEQGETITQSSVSKMLRGERGISVKFLVKISRFLRVSPSWLLGVTFYQIDDGDGMEDLELLKWLKNEVGIKSTGEGKYLLRPLLNPDGSLNRGVLDALDILMRANRSTPK